MAIGKHLALPFRYKPWRSLHFSLIAADLVGTGREPEREHVEHLRGAIEWLCHAQDIRNHASDSGGVSAGWNFEDGWLPSYPETTGYIIETFLAAAPLLARPDLMERARRMIDWELSLQQRDGAFLGHFGEPGSRPVIFNTGQIMHGMLAGYYQLQRQDCLEAAVRGGEWLAQHQEPEGYWHRFEYLNAVHTYNTRASWALVSTALAAGRIDLEHAARRNLDWAVAQQGASGWFANNAFAPGQHPFTHTIAYAIRGLLESGVLLRENRYIQSAEKAARAVARAQRADGYIAATLDDQWAPRAKYACLTGIAQMSLNWTRLAQHSGDESWNIPARKAIAFVKRHQRLAHPDRRIRGGIAGSAPIWGRYAMFEYPNWAAKFFADALIMDWTNTSVPPLFSTHAAGAKTV
jgi:Squalene-hopene cyclase C-terminal domain